MREPWTWLWHHSFLKILPSVLLWVTQSTHGSQAIRCCCLKWPGWFVDHTRHFSGLLRFTEAILVGSVISPVSWLSLFPYLAMCGYQTLLLWAGESTRWNSAVSHSVSYSPIFSLASGLPYLCHGFKKPYNPCRTYACATWKCKRIFIPWYKPLAYMRWSQRINPVLLHSIGFP